MKTSGNTVLITGGATGIGFSLAGAFLEHDNEVIICGRRENKLKEAKAGFPRLQTRVCDVSRVEERKALFDWVKTGFENINILVNNAGIQRIIDFKKGEEAFSDIESEIATNLVAPAHLSSLFVPLFMQNDAAIVNISSSLAFRPLPHVPIYCGTKAAIHAFSIALRKQLQETSVKVFEIVPPLVETELFKSSRARRQLPSPGLSPSILAAIALEAIRKDEYEVVVGEAIKSLQEGKEYLEQMARHFINPDLFQ
jgi:uncharacterized oxidoreductase